MIVWLLPAALAGLSAVIVPLAIHLLRRHQARRVVIPTVRFVPGATESAVRVRRLSDPWLLLTRVAIVACAALALARPLLVTGDRMDGWAARTARVIVADTSASVDAAAVAETISAEEQTSEYPLVTPARDLAPAIARAASWLAHAPPARREIVVVSDFAHGTLSPADLASVQPAIGVRFVPVASREPSPEVRTLVLNEGGLREQRVVLEGEATRVETTEVRPADVHGLRILAEASAAAHLLRVVSRAGAPAPDPSRPIAISFRGGSAGGGAPTGWMVEAGQRILGAPATSGIPLSVSAEGTELRVHADAEPMSLEAAAVVQAALEALVDPRTLSEHERVPIPRAVLEGWSRAPSPPAIDSWRQSEDSDGRWFWAAALVLMLVEMRLRRSVPSAAVVEGARAA